MKSFIIFGRKYELFSEIITIKKICLSDFIVQDIIMLNDCKKLINNKFMENKILENLEQLKKMLVLLSEERKVVLSHHKTFEHVEKMRAIVNESIEMANK